MRRYPLIFIAIIASVAPACAGVESDLAAIAARQKTCIDQDPSNVGMIQCSDEAHAAADRILNRVYEAVATRLKHDADADSKETLRRLVASERAWIAYRDTECNFEGTSMLGGSGEGLIINDCLYLKTAERAKTLHSVLDPN